MVLVTSLFLGIFYSFLHQIKSRFFTSCTLIVAIIVCSFLSAHAELYQWTDNSGTVNFTDDYANIPKKYRGKATKTDNDTNSTQEVVPAPSARNIAPAIKVADAEPVVTERYEYYAIAGRSAKELRHQMSKLGPRSEIDGKVYDAETRWQVNWHFNYRATKDECVISSVKTTLNIIFAMPQWNDAAESRFDLNDSWNAFIRKLQYHEEGHRDLAVQAANEIHRAIAGLPPMKSYNELSVAANQRGQDILANLKQLSADYDVRTNHGKTQGARFP